MVRSVSCWPGQTHKKCAPSQHYSTVPGPSRANNAVSGQTRPIWPLLSAAAL